MTTTVFDTLKFAKRLQEAEFTEKQAEVLSDAFKDVQNPADLATRGDIVRLENRINILENKVDTNRWLLLIIVIAVLAPLAKDLFTAFSG